MIYFILREGKDRMIGRLVPCMAGLHCIGFMHACMYVVEGFLHLVYFCTYTVLFFQRTFQCG